MSRDGTTGRAHRLGPWWTAFLVGYAFLAVAIAVVAPSPWVAVAVVPHALLAVAAAWSTRAARRDRATGELVRFHLGCAIFLVGTWGWVGILIGFLAWPEGSP